MEVVEAACQKGGWVCEKQGVRLLVMADHTQVVGAQPEGDASPHICGVSFRHPSVHSLSLSIPPLDPSRHLVLHHLCHARLHRHTDLMSHLPACRAQAALLNTDQTQALSRVNPPNYLLVTLLLHDLSRPSLREVSLLPRPSAFSSVGDSSPRTTLETPSLPRR